MIGTLIGIIVEVPLTPLNFSLPKIIPLTIHCALQVSGQGTVGGIASIVRLSGR